MVTEVHTFLESLGLEQYKLVCFVYVFNTIDRINNFFYHIFQKFVDAELKLPGVMNVLNGGLLDRIGVKDPIHKMTLLQNGPLRSILSY